MRDNLWNITEGEKKRILNLHLNATKNHYLLGENNRDMENSMTEIPFKFNFKSGWWSQKSMGTNKIPISISVKESLEQVKNYIIKNKGATIDSVVISSGESAVPNRDAENNLVGLNSGVLGKRRSITIQSLLNQGFKELFDNGLIEQIPRITINEPILGDETDSKSPRAFDQQFVEAKFILTVPTPPIVPEKTPESPQVRCNFECEIMVYYTPVNPNLSYGEKNPRFHCCDDAIFSLLLNGIEIEKENGDSLINLNNKQIDCGARSEILIVTEEKANEILKVKSPAEVVFKCKSPKCHESPMMVSTKRSGEEFTKGQYLGGSLNKINQNTEIVVGQMDECGVITPVKPYIKK